MTGKVFPLRLTYCILITTVLIAAVVFVVKCYTPGKVARGVHIHSVDFSGVDRKGGYDLLATIERDLGRNPVTVNCGQQTWKLMPREVGVEIEKDAVMERALSTGRKKDIWARQGPVEVQLLFNFNPTKLEEWAERVAGNCCRQPVEAGLHIGGDDSVEITPSSAGLCVDTDRLWSDLSRVLANDDPERRVTLGFKEVEPQLTTAKAQNMGITGLLSEFETEFDSTVVNRAYNIKVAAGALDGLLVEPGQEVSFNDIVGPRSSEAGYKNAQVILNNAMVDGVGGGVCQVTSTLYNAVLLAGLEITERASHSLPVWYVPLGRDATVVYRQIDLKFRNNSENYLYLKSLFEEGKLTFRIYGNVGQKKEVTVNSEIIGETEPEFVFVEDPALPSGVEEVKQEGGKGYKVKTERLFLDREGEPIKKELLSISVYKPVNRIIAVGIEGEDKKKVESSNTED